MKKEIKKEEIIKMTEEEHRAYHRRLVYTFAIIMVVFFGGATVFYSLERAQNISYIDALYFSAYTITTVGYGDITPKTDAGKIFTIFFLFTGVGIALYGLSLMASHFVEVREEFFLERFAKIRLRHHTETIWEKIKKAFSFKSDVLVEEHENSSKANRQKK